MELGRGGEGGGAPLTMMLSKASAPFGPTTIANGSRPKSSVVTDCAPSGADRCSGRFTVAVPLGVRSPHDVSDSVRLAATPRPAPGLSERPSELSTAEQQTHPAETDQPSHPQLRSGCGPL